MTNANPEFFKKPYKPQKRNNNQVNLFVCLVAGIMLVLVGLTLSPLVILAGVILSVLGIVLFATKSPRGKE